VLLARLGSLFQTENDDRSHHGTALLALLGAGAGAADVMLK
jgi:hypothetical protein